MDAHELYRAGRLADAIGALNAAVREKPLDTSLRGFLCELLCAAGNLERADKLLEALVIQEPDAAVGLALFRQLVRAEQSRRQLWADGRVPEFLSDPPPALRLLLEATVATRAGDAEGAARLCEQAETTRPRTPGVAGDRAFEDFRDLDDLHSAFFEVLTSTGKYYWIPTERVEVVEFEAPSRPRDLYWRRAQMSVRDGPDGVVYVPAVYVGSEAAGEAALLGRCTEWAGGEGTPVRGLGQRTYLLGEDAVPALELTRLEFRGA